MVTKTIRFDAAHVLTNHAGLCKNLHGHTYRVDVCVGQQGDDSSDMVIDFKDLKHVCEEVILARFDHAFVYNSTSKPESEIAEVVMRHGMRVVAIPYRSTAENFAKLFFHDLAERIPNLARVTVWETPDSCAAFYGDEVVFSGGSAS